MWWVEGKVASSYRRCGREDIDSRIMHRGIDGMTRRLRPVDGNGGMRGDVNGKGAGRNYSNLLCSLLEKGPVEPSGDRDE